MYKADMRVVNLMLGKSMQVHNMDSGQQTIAGRKNNSKSEQKSNKGKSELV